MGDESCLIRSTRTTLTADPNRRHPFTKNIIEVPLPEKWKGFNRDRYDGSTDPDEHMDAYTTEPLHLGRRRLVPSVPHILEGCGP